MTEKDRIIQDLRQRVAGLEEEIAEIIRATESCRYCARIHEDCMPGEDCEPVWRGKRNVRS